LFTPHFIFSSITAIAPLLTLPPAFDLTLLYTLSDRPTDCFGDGNWHEWGDRKRTPILPNSTLPAFSTAWHQPGLTHLCCVWDASHPTHNI